jgi:hypothetical protein
VLQEWKKDDEKVVTGEEGKAYEQVVGSPVRKKIMSSFSL